MKQKVCSRCEKPNRIWARGLCRKCDIAVNPKKYLLEKKKIEKKKKAESVTSLKKKLDTIFSIYIRQKYEVDGLVECYTCGVQKPIPQMQNGHFWSRSNLSVRWDEDNCRPQCSGCNVFKHGNYIVYTQKMMQELGEDLFEALELKKNIPYSPSKEWLTKQIEFYTLNTK
jgi:5-methylcytosine-specific restriction endonuclease McrA